MSDIPSQPSETVNDTELNALKPPSNPDDYNISMSVTAGDPGCRADHTKSIVINGLQNDDDESDDAGEEEVGGDYVAIHHNDTSDFPSWYHRAPGPRRSALDDLHPFVQVLSLANVDDCVKVENAFPEPERCSREKFIYRINKCPELTLGLFTLPPLSEGRPKPRATLVGHIVATRTSSPRVTDASMRLPENWKTERISLENGEVIGHDERGSTIVVHSLAVHPEYQGIRVGSTLMKAYIQRIKDAGIADRVAIIAHEHLLPFYESFGFQNNGLSKCQFGGGGWIDLALEFSHFVDE